MQQSVEKDAAFNIQQCWELLANDIASICTGLKPIAFTTILYILHPCSSHSQFYAAM